MAKIPVILSSLVAGVAIFLAWSPSDSWQKEHFSQEPFSWPASLQYSGITLADGTVLHTVIAGPSPNESKGVMIFVHGFPETARCWKEYILYYASKGYHVCAPDMRNVNNSISTQNMSMTLDLVADDLLAVLMSTGHSKAVVVGHDWGAAAVWFFALKYPQYTAALVNLAVPHPELYRTHGLIHLPFSLRHIWYFLFYGLTGPLARWKVAKDDFAWALWFMHGSSDPKTFSAAEIKDLKVMYNRTLTSETSSTMTSWYSMGCWWVLKGILPSFMQPAGLLNSIWGPNMPSLVPTLQIFGSRDIYVTPGMQGFAPSSQYVSHPVKRTVILDATHWLNHEKKGEIMREIDSFLEIV